MAEQDGKSEKEKLFKRLIQKANPYLVLERMRLHGFWPYGKPLPPDPPAEAEERAQVEKEISALSREQATLKDPENALAEERKRRWEESKKRRAERKARQAEERARRRDAWRLERQKTIVHAGLGVSAGLEGQSSDEEALTRLGLPVMHTSRDLAEKLGISIARLRWLTYHRRGATLVHYHRFSIPKKTGGIRAISAPKPELSAAQHWVLTNVLERLSFEDPAHGFVRHRSIVTNAAPHVGRAFVVNLDLKDFFPSLTFRRVKGLFASLGYSEHVATVLSLLCTEPPRIPADLDGERYYVALGARGLPQGACTSPALTNAICRGLDRRLGGLASRHRLTYTRYADDLTLSGEDASIVGAVLKKVRGILADEGFSEHPQKTRVMRPGRRQEVTGVTVNAKVSVPRDYVRQLRAVLHNAARSGLESQNREGHPSFPAYLRGRVEFVCMVDPSRRPALQAALARALRT